MSLRLTWITLAALTCCSIMLGCAPFKPRSGSKAVPTGAASGRAAGPEQLDGLLHEAPPRTAQKPAKSFFGGDNAKKEAAKQSEIDSELALARLGERRGQSDGAKQLYRKIIEKHPQHPAAYHRLAVLHARDNNFAESNRYFEHALQMGDISLDLLSDYGYCLYLQSQHEDAERVLRQALRQKPNHEASCNNLGLVLGAQGRYQESLEAFQRVNNEAEAHANLAYVFSQAGDLENARKGYLQALTLNKQLKPAAVAVIQVEKRLQMQEQERARIAQQKAAEAAEANAQPAAPPVQTAAPQVVQAPAPVKEAPSVVQAPAPVIEAPVRRAMPEVVAQQPAKSRAPAAIAEEEEIVELPPVRIATRPTTVERSAPQPVAATPAPQQEEAPLSEAPRSAVKAPSIAQPTLPRTKIVPAKPAPVAMETAEETRELEAVPRSPALTAASPPAKVTAPSIAEPQVVTQPVAPTQKPSTIPAAEPIAKSAPATVDQKSDFVLRPATPATETAPAPAKPELVSPQPIAATTPIAKPISKPSSDFVPAVTSNAVAPSPVAVPDSKPIASETPKLTPVRDIVKAEPSASSEPEKKAEVAAQTSEFQPQPRVLTAINEASPSQPIAPRASEDTADKPRQIVMTPRVIEPVKQSEMIVNPTIKKGAVASSTKPQLTSLGQSITQGAPVAARPATTPARVTTIAKPISTAKPTPITVEPVTEGNSPQLAPIVSSEQFSARKGSSNTQPRHSVRTALTPIDDDSPSQSNGLGSFITTKPAAKGTDLPPIVSPEEHRQRAMRR